ncbi:MAG: hypothetical protein AB7E60_11670 [Sphingobium sp.]
MPVKLIASKEAGSNVPSTFAAMKTAKRWLLFSPDKVPHYIDGTKRRGTLDAPEDIAWMATYGEALAILAKCDPGWHLGFALGSDDRGGSR